MTQKELKRLVKLGVAKDITNSSSRKDIQEDYSQVGYSSGVYGCNGMLLRGKALYAPFDKNESLYIYDTFAKYALEEVANRFQDWWYDQDESDFGD